MSGVWGEKRLGDLCDVLDSKRKPITKRDREPGEYPYYGATGVLDYVSGYIYDEPLVLVGEDGAKWGAGESTAFAVEGKVWVNNHAHVLRPHQSELVDKWLIYYLNHSDLTEFVSGLTVPKLNQGSLREIPVPLPPVDEQHRITRILDEMFTGIATAKANAEKNLQNARSVFESELSSVFARRGDGWMETTVGESCTLKSGTTVSPSLEKQVGRFPYVKVADMTIAGNEEWITTSSRFLDEEDVGKNAVFPIGTTLFPKRGGAILTNKKRITAVPVCSDLNIMGVIPGSGLLPQYLHFYFLNVDMRELGSGSSIPQINNYDIAPLKIAIPASMKQQDKVVERLATLKDETQRLATVYERKAHELNALKRSLLHHAFTGQL